MGGGERHAGVQARHQGFAVGALSVVEICPERRTRTSVAHLVEQEQHGLRLDARCVVANARVITRNPLGPEQVERGLVR